MGRYARLGYIELSGYLARGEVFLFEEFEYLAPGGVVQCFEKGIQLIYIFRQMSKYFSNPQILSEKFAGSFISQRNFVNCNSVTINTLCTAEISLKPPRWQASVF